MTIIQEVAEYAIHKAAKLSAERGGREVFSDADFDAAWEMYRIFYGQHVLAERPPWLRTTPKNRGYW